MVQIQQPRSPSAKIRGQESSDESPSTCWRAFKWQVDPISCATLADTPRLYLSRPCEDTSSKQREISLLLNILIRLAYLSAAAGPRVLTGPNIPLHFTSNASQNIDALGVFWCRLIVCLSILVFFVLSLRILNGWGLAGIKALYWMTPRPLVYIDLPSSI